MKNQIVFLDDSNNYSILLCYCSVCFTFKNKISNFCATVEEIAPYTVIPGLQQALQILHFALSCFFMSCNFWSCISGPALSAPLCPHHCETVLRVEAKLHLLLRRSQTMLLDSSRLHLKRCNLLLCSGCHAVRLTDAEKPPYLDYCTSQFAHGTVASSSSSSSCCCCCTDVRQLTCLRPSPTV